MPKRYVTWGSVRGKCKHRHRSLRAALDCMDRDHAACRRQFGYSDRAVYRDDLPPVHVDGKSRPASMDGPDHLEMDWLFSTGVLRRRR